ncbi:MAG: hypothetical protein U5K69_28355 [Balneolaceae bacterium]|nr:hypothetical protein [Balneolaceae bacterium]
MDYSHIWVLYQKASGDSDITQFKIDYTIWMNLVFIWVASDFWLNRKYLQNHIK